MSVEKIKALREKTGAGMMDCKKALSEASGDFEKAVEYLRKKGIASASKKADRITREGAVTSYIHGEGKVGVLVEVNCETDFVARTEHFRQLVKDIAMHIAAAQPRWIHSSEVSEEILAKEKEIARAQNTASVESVVEKFFQEHCLMQQKFIKCPSKTIDELLKESIATLGENLSIRRFVRFVLGGQGS